MPRPKKTDASKQPPPVIPAPPPAMAPMPIQQMAPQQFAPPPMGQSPMGQPPMGQPPMQMAPAPMPVPQKTIGVDDFIKVRDSIHQQLVHLTQLMKGTADNFARHTSLLLGENVPLENGGPNSMAALMEGLDGIGGQLGGLLSLPEEKKERKKRTHDPNAPKRPLTPYFLYMQTARPIIANDLGVEAPKGAVQEEGQRRWSSMSHQEKTAWNNAYQFNLRLYHARVHSYKAGNPDARNMSDPEALAYADANGIPQPVLSGDDNLVPNDQDAIAEQLQQLAVPNIPSPEDSSRTPKPKQSRKRKSTAADDEGDASGTKNATPASPDKKPRKRVSKAADFATEEPKKSGRKKKST